MSNRRLDGNVRAGLPPEMAAHDQQVALDKVHRRLVDAEAIRAGIALKPLESDWYVGDLWARAGGDESAFAALVRQEMAYFAERNPDRVHPSALRDYLTEELTDDQIAGREIAAWFTHAHYFWFDTETTGLTGEHVAWSAGGIHLQTGEPWELFFRPVDATRNRVRCTAEATKVHGQTDADLGGLPLLEENPEAIEMLEWLVEAHAVLLSFNAHFDRAKFIATLSAAVERVRANGDARRITQLSGPLTWFGGREHWIEVKDVFTRAIGRGRGKDARSLRLVDIAHIVGALAPTAVQPHGARADAEVMHRIGTIVTKREEPMPRGKKDSEAAAATAVTETPPAQRPPLAGDGRDEVGEYLNTLESNVDELQAENLTLKGQTDTLQSENEHLRNTLREGQAEFAKQDQRIAELEALLAAQSGAATPQPVSAELVAVINGVPITIRQHAATVEAATRALMDGVKALARSGQFKAVKVGSGEPKDAPPPAQQQAPANEPPAQPKGNVPPKTNTPPKNSPPPVSTGGDGAEVEGEARTKLYHQIARVINEDGGNKYRLYYKLDGGGITQYPDEIRQERDVKTLEKTLTEAGIDCAGMEVKKPYDIVLRADWEVGPEVKGSKYHAHFKNKWRATVIAVN